MHKKYYPQLDETVYSDVLSNGLRVYLIPKEGFAKTYGILTTDFGSIDNHFVPYRGEKGLVIPDGMAHFLEHKLFEGENGDAFEDFARLGASANAFTSFTRTSYLFSATNHVKENVAALLDFVQEPHFTPEGTEKEKGIIAQEISMYDDEPGWRLFYGLLKNLYPNHPLSIDIAGTVGSIQEITPELLQLCYETFYHPSNMNMLLIGSFDPETILEFIQENQDEKTFAQGQHILRFLPEENLEQVKPYEELHMDVIRPKVALGIKGLNSILDGAEADRYYLIGSLFLEILFGKGSSNYMEMYDSGLIDDSFGYSFNMDRSFHFLVLEADTDEPETARQRWREILLHWRTDADFTEENFTLLKRALIGEQLQAFNSLEYIANQFGYLQFRGIDLFERIERIESLTFEELEKFGEQYIREPLFSSFVIKPKRGEDV